MTLRALRVWLVVALVGGVSLAAGPVAWAADATPVPVETDAPSPPPVDIPAPPVDVPVATETPTEVPVFTADAVAPTLLLNGQSNSLTVPIGTSVTIMTDPSTAMVNIWNGGTCSGSPITSVLGVGSALTRMLPETFSMQAFDPANPLAVSACLAAQWVVPVPVLLLNGQTGPLTVPIGASVTIMTDPSTAMVNIWNGGTCSGSPITSVLGVGSALTRMLPETFSMQAFDPTFPSTVSACLAVQWVVPPPTLLLNGQAGSLTVSTGTDITVTTDPTSASFNLWTNGDCSGRIDATFSGVGTTFSSNDPLVNSVQAFDPADPSLASGCLTMTWTAPTPTPTPTTAPSPISLFLDGQANSLTLAVGDGIIVTADPQTSTILYWENADCSGTASGAIGSGFGIQGLAPQVLSFQASDPADASNTSACLAATWAEPTPTPVVTPTLTPTPVIVPGAPILYLNGWPNSIVVPLRTLVTVTSDPALATIHYWANADCSGDPTGVLGSGFAIEGDAPDVLSFQAEDQGAAGACLSATWGDVQATVTPSATATATATEAAPLTPTIPDATATPTPTVADSTATPTSTLPATTTPTGTEPTMTPTVAEPTVSPTSTATGSVTATPTGTSTTIVTVTATTTATTPATFVATQTPTASPTGTATLVPTGTPSGTVVPSPSPSPVRTDSVMTPTVQGPTVPPTSAAVRSLPNTGAGSPPSSQPGNPGAIIILLLVGGVLLASGTAWVRRSPHRRR